MNIFIRNCCLICLTLIVGCSSAQQAGNQYAFKVVGWSLTLLPQFSVIDSAKTAALNQRGKKLIEEYNDIKTDFSGTKTLITAMKGNDHFNSTITPFGPEDGDYNTSCKKVKDLIFNTFVDKIPNAKIDSSSTSATVGGLDFDFGISYLYLDEISKGQIESILNSSRFH